MNFLMPKLSFSVTSMFIARTIKADQPNHVPSEISLAILPTFFLESTTHAEPYQFWPHYWILSPHHLALWFCPVEWPPFLFSMKLSVRYTYIKLVFVALLCRCCCFFMYSWSLLLSRDSLVMYVLKFTLRANRFSY